MAEVGVPKVSVVVPAYNCGPHIEKLAASLLRQSLPADEFEAIFVDDGSTDDTAERLDRLAAEHPHIRVLHIENSGWPSRPRNLGIEQARGEYVFFADDDDWFADEALERLHACAKANDADIVVGKMAGYGRPVPRELFRKNRFDATLGNSPLIDSLTCHKLFRRSFLNEHGLRFPEGGKRRLEDHSFVVRAYFLSRRTSVLSDYTCYHHVQRGDGHNVTAGRLDPSGYFASVREALDVVDANTEPGALRDRLHRRWLRNEMLSRLRGKRLLGAPRRGWTRSRWRSRRSSRTASPLAWPAGCRPAPSRGVPGGAGPRRGPAQACLLGGGHRRTRHDRRTPAGRPRRHGDRRRRTALRGPAGRLPGRRRPRRADAPDGGDRPEVLDATAQVRKARLDLVARHRETGAEIFLPNTFQTERITGTTGADTVHLVHRATATIDFAALNGGRTRGSWLLKARITNVGWTEDARLPLVFICRADGSRPRIRDERKVWNRLRSAVGRRIKR